MHSDAPTVDEYLEALPEERRDAISAVRQVILDNLPTGLVETMSYGMICYEVPLETYPTTYNGKPLVYAGLASQKRHMAVYLTAVYGSQTLRERFEEEYRATGKRLDMGKSCVRFTKLENLPLDVVGRAVGAVTLEQFLAFYDQLASMRTSKKTRS